MRIAREGWPFVIVSLVLAAALTAAAGLSSWGGWTVMALGAGVTAVFVLFFFRDPRREVAEERRAVVSPADGRVIEVVEVEEPSVLEGPCRRISIFLSIFDVHVQRAPVEGSVVHRSYQAGGYAVAWAPKASEENEQATLGIETGGGEIVLVRQIAGLIARRIVTYPEEGDGLERGERIGLIRFGSRVDLFLPLSWEILCGPGDRAVGGETVLALRPEPSPAVPEDGAEEEEGRGEAPAGAEEPPEPAP